ncbi:hypothetical protein KY333_05510 [Candidatus Woesearchaeota archaeon]|nr:hypothetical protein [Candidatus Woesearchaeota archaeon]MBW2993886.1 hypothetical protein [Candidatus Woesearchaeota archaeon]
MDKPDVKGAAEAIRQLKEWLAVFAEEYDLAPEAKAKLSQKIDEVVQQVANISCE